MITIYLSSTYEDLKDYRSVVFDALRRSGYEVIAMEDYVARDDRPLKACLDDVGRADIYVGLFAFRYGYIPPADHGNADEKSITELEFRFADSSPNTHCLLFIMDEKAGAIQFSDAYSGEGDKGERIRRFRDELRREKMASSFTSPHELASKVQSAVKIYTDKMGHPVEQPDTHQSEITWDVDKLGSPYPGLLHFTRKYAPVFFGRDSETRELLDRLTQPEGRFIIVSGDSGSGKSSLVDAGVLSRLENAENDSPTCLRMVPSGGADPFDALLRALRPLAERAALDDYQLGRDLAAGDRDTIEVLRDLLQRGLPGGRLLLFLDQMEELFTAREQDPALVQRFLTDLHGAAQTLPLQVLATIRSDLLHHCYANPEMLSMLNGRGHYALGHTAPYSLHDMIVRPAQCAGVQVPDALSRKLMDDVGTRPGNLPLLAFVLQRLFTQYREDISLPAYDRMGGMIGAIADHVAEVELGLEQQLQLGREELDSLFAELFGRLVRVDVEGLPTRRRMQISALAEPLQAVAQALIKARLLTTEGKDEASVAHERLFEAWPALAHWVAEHQDDLRLLRQGELDAREWRQRDHDLAYLWHTDRLKRLQQVIDKLPPDRNIEPALRDFAQPQKQLLTLLNDPEMAHTERDNIGNMLVVLGDTRPGVGLREDGTPDIDWVAIPGGDVELENDAGHATVDSFHMARYLVTNIQFQAFIDAEDGYGQADWWLKMPPEANTSLKKPRWSEPNHPRESVSWYEAVPFCRWLSHRLGFEVRLPDEFEWQQAATGGNPQYAYPWGEEWDERLCNTQESGLNRTTAVGLYPSGASAQGILDLSGNLMEWCISKHEQPDDVTIDDSAASRVVRGGAWYDDLVDARADDRGSLGRPDYRLVGLGFRVLCVSPIR